MAEPRAESVLLSLSFTQDKITCMNESELNTVHAKIQKQHFKVKVTYSDTFLADFDSNPTINRNPIKSLQNLANSMVYEETHFFFFWLAHLQ